MADYYWIWYRTRAGTSTAWGHTVFRQLFYGNPFSFDATGGAHKDCVWPDGTPYPAKRISMQDWRKATEEELDLYEKALQIKLAERKKNRKCNNSEELELGRLLALINRAAKKRFAAVPPEMRATYKSHGVEKMKLVVWSLTDQRSPVHWDTDKMRHHITPTKIFRPTKFQAKVETAESCWLEVFRAPYPEKKQ